jgi:Flp pilus assembly protein TadB
MHSHQTAGELYTSLDVVGTVSYLGTLFYWIFSFATKEQERKEFSPQMQQFLLLMGGGARAGRIALSDLPSERSRKRIK